MTESNESENDRMTSVIKYIFKRLMQFSVELFFCCSTVDCLHLHFIVLRCVVGNALGMGITQREFFGNGNKTQTWEWEWVGMGTDCMGMGGNGDEKKSITGHT